MFYKMSFTSCAQGTYRDDGGTKLANYSVDCYCSTLSSHKSWDQWILVSSHTSCDRPWGMNTTAQSIFRPRIFSSTKPVMTGCCNVHRYWIDFSKSLHSMLFNGHWLYSIGQNRTPDFDILCSVRWFLAREALLCKATC